MVLKLLKRHFLLYQFIKFTIVGGLGTIIDFLIYIFLTRSFLFWQKNFLWANFISVFLSATFNFVLNKKWTFKDKSKKIFVQYIKFWIIVLTGLLIYQSIFYSLVKTLSIYDIVSKLIAVIISGIYRFISHKYWTFSK